MKNLSIAFLAAMSLASFGCKNKGGDSGGYTAAMDGFATKMCACKDKACADGVTTEMAKWTTDYASKPGAAKVSAGDEGKVAEAGKKLADCQLKVMADAGSAMAGSAAPMAAGSDMAGSAAPMAAGSDMAGSDMAGSAAPMAAGSDMAGSAMGTTTPAGDLPQECLDYKAATEKFSACEKAPQATRDAMKSTYDSAASGWATAAATPAGKETVASACKSATDGLKQSATGLGCTL